MTDTRRIREPPAVQDDPNLTLWLRDLATEINTLPRTSLFSFSTPESNVTAQTGTIGVNFASDQSVVWVKQLGSDNTGWAAIA